MKVSNVFNLLPDSLESLDTFQLGIENELYEDGNLYAYEILAKLRLLEKLVKSMTKSPRFMHAVSSELSEKENDYGLYSISESSRKTWDFEKDETYKSLKGLEEEAKANVKLHTSFVTSLSEDKFKDGMYIDEETGEMFQQPEILKDATIIKISWKKPKSLKDYKEVGKIEGDLPF